MSEENRKRVRESGEPNLGPLANLAGEYFVAYHLVGYLPDGGRVVMLRAENPMQYDAIKKLVETAADGLAPHLG